MTGTSVKISFYSTAKSLDGDLDSHPKAECPKYLEVYVDRHSEHRVAYQAK